MQTRKSCFARSAPENKAAPRKKANTVKCQTVHNSDTLIPLNCVRNDRDGDFLRPIKTELTDEYDELSEPLVTSEPVSARRSMVCHDDTRTEEAIENYNVIGLTTRKNGEAVNTDFLIKIMLSLSLENRDLPTRIKTANIEEGTSFYNDVGSKCSMIPAKTQVSQINQEKNTIESNTKLLLNQKTDPSNNSSLAAPLETSDSTEFSWQIGESILCQWEPNPAVHYKMKIVNIEEGKNGQPVYTIHLKNFEVEHDAKIAHNNALTRI
ncbi:hypothetical protein Ddc_04595 [Ditylenchus destructor]|nr:hypothetical protein Ddc_04595 [Ditylenchus destructor]